MRQKAALAALIVAVIGVGVSVYLAWHHNKAITDPAYKSFCSVNQTIDCDAVNASEQSEIPLPFTGGKVRIPVAQLSFLFYAGLAWLAWMRFSSEDDGLVAISYAFFLSIAGMLFSLYMGYVSFVVLKKLCIFCTALYGIGVAFPVLAFMSTDSSAGEMWSAVREDLGAAWFNRAAIGLFALVILLLGSQIPRWGATDGAGGNAAAMEKAWAEAPKALVGPGSAYGKGAKKPTVTVVKFSDFQCPACRMEAGVLRQLVKEYPNDLRVYYRHLPLDQRCNPTMSRTVHEHACTAAAASECAGQQGKFWEYHDLLFPDLGKPKPDYSLEGLEGLAGQLDVDVEEFRTCMDEDKSVKSKITQDIREANFIGASSTPTLVINKRRMSRALSYEQWRTILELNGVELLPSDPDKTAAHDPENGHTDHDGHNH